MTVEVRMSSIDSRSDCCPLSLDGFGKLAAQLFIAHTSEHCFGKGDEERAHIGESLDHRNPCITNPSATFSVEGGRRRYCEDLVGVFVELLLEAFPRRSEEFFTVAHGTDSTS